MITTAAVGQQERTERSTSTDRFIRFFLLCAVLLAMLLRLLWLQTVVARDEGASGYIASVWLAGHSPYTPPMAAINPPLAYLIYLVPISIFGDNVIPVRLLNDALFFGSIVSIFLIADQWYGRKIALVSSIFYAVFMNAPIFETQLAIPSSLSIPLMVFAVHLFTIYQRRMELLWLFFSGIMASLAALVVQNFAAGVGMIFLFVFVFSLRGTARETIDKTHIFGRSLILLLGAFLPIAVVLGYFSVNGGAYDLLQNTVLRFSSSQYFGQPEVYGSVEFLIILEALPLWCFLIPGVIIALLRRKTGDLFAVMWIIFFLPIALPVPHFGRHFSQLIPPASLLAGQVLEGVTDSTKLVLAMKRISHPPFSIAGIFVITTLLLSSIPTFYSWQVQYPNTNVTLWNQTFYYSFSSDWNQQQQIVNFLKSHAAGEPILIHGWEAELYWLSGQTAPGIRWASSYKSLPPDITQTAYLQILDKVKQSYFRYVVLLNSFPSDEIMQSVPTRYFFVERIGMYDIYSKINAQGYELDYNFGPSLALAAQEYHQQNGVNASISALNDPTYVITYQQLTVGNVTKNAIKQIPILPVGGQNVESYLTYRNITIPPNAVLHFSTAMDPASWVRNVNGVNYRIFVQTHSTTREVFSTYMNPAQNITQKQWVEQSVSLAEYGGTTINIIFATEPGPTGSNAYAWSYWGEPMLLSMLS